MKAFLTAGAELFCRSVGAARVQEDDVDLLLTSLLLLHAICACMVLSTAGPKT
jgi:hypothetical protein